MDSSETTTSSNDHNAVTINTDQDTASAATTQDKPISQHKLATAVEKKSTTMIDNVRTEPPTKKSRLLRELENSDGFTTAADRNKQGQSSGHRRKLPITSVDNSYHQTNTL